MITNKENNKEVITFKTKDQVTVNLHGEPNYDIWAKKMINLCNQS
ncbi:hypothetical protein QWY16_09375 [Planococcus shenhongbingii]|nr:hypothetical protein [Planococcus sp. N016]WKA60294.1 hypothetical protein QWY16_09375 [Planococcus sp. N016]